VTFEEYTRHIDWPLTVDRRRARHGYGGLYPAGYSLLAPYLLAVSGTRASIAAATVLFASFVLRAS
jgi:hypothetical protein